MNPLDPHLRDAFRRQPAPEGFAERVLARATQPPARPVKRPWLAAASFLAVVGPLALGYRAYQAHRQAEAARAQAQLVLALRITNQKLDLAFHHLQSPQE